MTANARSRHRGEAYDRLVRQEELILDVTERLTKALLDAGITRAELARRLGRTPGFVSQVLGGGRNLTLRTIADIAAALALQPSLELSSKGPPVANPEDWIDEDWGGKKQMASALLSFPWPGAQGATGELAAA